MLSIRSYQYVIINVIVSIAFLFTGCSSGGGGGATGTPVTATSAPAAPLSIIAVAGNNMVSISWSAVSTATSYMVYRSLTSGTTSTGTVLTSNLTTNVYTDSTAANGATYYYAVAAKNSYGRSKLSIEVNASPSSSPTPSIITINGAITYEDKEYYLNNASGAGGFTGTTSLKAVRYADVELVKSSATVSSTTTAADGTYSFQVSAATNTGQTFYVRVSSSSTPAASQSIEVKNIAGTIYAAAGSNFVLLNNTTANLSVPVSNTAGGAFNILDVLTNGFEFVDSLDGVKPLSLSAFWNTGNSLGTYFCNVYDATYCPRGAGIYVYNGSSDTDEYDDDVLYHEFGHFVAANYSQDDSPGGAHYLDGNDYDLRLTWSEGWGDFFPGAVKNWLNSTNPTLLSSQPGTPLTSYVDTSGSSGWGVDMANPDSSPYCGTNCKHSSNEVAVAKVLSDLRSGFTMTAVWDVVVNFTATPVNLETFWDEWLSSGKSSALAVQAYYDGRSIFYKIDDMEVDDLIASASTYTIGISSPQTHTLYSAGDADFVTFLVSDLTKTIQITTSNLINGADTLLTLIDTDQVTVIASNDNTAGLLYTAPFNCGYDSYGNWFCHENGNDLLGSTIKFKPSSAGWYYVKVTTSADRPASAGKYGSYTLTITSP